MKRKCNIIDFAKLKETGLLTCAEDSVEVHSHRSKTSQYNCVSFCSHNQVLELIKVGTLPGEQDGRGEMHMPGNDFRNGLWNLGCI